MLNFVSGLHTLLANGERRKFYILDYLSNHEDFIIQTFIDSGFYCVNKHGLARTEKAKIDLLQSPKERLAQIQKQLAIAEQDTNICLGAWVKQAYNNFRDYIDNLGIGNLAEFKLLEMGVIEVKIDGAIFPPCEHDDIDIEGLYQFKINRLLNMGLSIQSSEFIQNGYEIEDTIFNRRILSSLFCGFTNDSLIFTSKTINGNYYIESFSMVFVPECIEAIQIETVEDDFRLHTSDVLNESEFKSILKTLDDMKSALLYLPPTNLTQQSLIELGFASISRIVGYNGKIFDVVEQRAAIGKEIFESSREVEQELAANLQANNVKSAIENFTRNLNRFTISNCGFKASDICFLGNADGTAMASLRFIGSKHDLIMQRCMFRNAKEEMPQIAQDIDKSWDIADSNDGYNKYLLNTQNNMAKIRNVLSVTGIRISNIEIRVEGDNFIINKINIVVLNPARFL